MAGGRVTEDRLERHLTRARKDWQGRTWCYIKPKSREESGRVVIMCRPGRVKGAQRWVAEWQG